MLFLRALAAAALSLASVPATPQTAPVHSGLLRDANSYGEVLPPTRYEQDNGAVVIFGHDDVIARLCGPRNADGVGPIACTARSRKTPIVVLPNPCAFAEHDLYAAIACHELGHVNGWPATHGD